MWSSGHWVCGMFSCDSDRTAPAGTVIEMGVTASCRVTSKLEVGQSSVDVFDAMVVVTDRILIGTLLALVSTRFTGFVAPGYRPGVLLAMPNAFFSKLSQQDFAALLDCPPFTATAQKQ